MEVENERLKRERWEAERQERRSLTDLDPTGRVVSRGEVEDAGDRMTEQVERSPRENPQPPRMPHYLPRSLRAEAELARTEATRENHAEPERPPSPEPIDALDWLREETRRHGLEERPDYTERDLGRDRR